MKMTFTSTLLLGFAIAVLIAACGSSTTASKKPTGSLTFAVFNPFTGPDASFGPEQMGGCVPATALINKAGGILGDSHVKCQAVDSKGDPADAVPALRQAVATVTGLVGVLGPSSDEATATMPILERSHITAFSDTGQTAFNQTSFRYFWRNTPADDANGYAIAAWAHRVGYERAAVVVGTDIGSLGQDPALKQGFRKLGGTIVIDQHVPLDQSSYRTEVEQLVAANPQVIFLEIDPQSSATYLAELKQLRGLITVIGTDITVEPQWQKAVVGSVGKAAVSRYFTGTQPYAPVGGPAWAIFNKQLLASGSSVPNPSQWSADPYSMAAYDAVNIMALAMTAAGSTSSAVYNGYIERITTAGAGKTVVDSFAAGKSALAAGKSIQYVGATGATAFDRWHNSPGSFTATAYGSAASRSLTKVLGVITPAQISAAR